MDGREQATARWPVDLEAMVAKNLRSLRESHGLSQHQLGSDLALHGFGIHYTTVVQIEVGARPLRLNEVAALAALFQVPIESLWQKRPETLDESESESESPSESESESKSESGSGSGDERERAQEREAADQAARQEQITADYYSQQRRERLRDK